MGVVFVLPADIRVLYSLTFPPSSLEGIDSTVRKHILETPGIIPFALVHIPTMNGMSPPPTGKRRMSDPVAEEPNPAAPATERIYKRARGSSRSSSRTNTRLSPSPRVPHTSNLKTPAALVLDILQSQEIFLNVLSFLNAKELAKVEGVSKYWQQMSLDRQLWKALYLASQPPLPLSVPSSGRFKRTRPPIATSSSSEPTPSFPVAVEERRPIEEIPILNLNDPSIDWKTLVKVATNWSTGNATLHTLSPSPSPARTPARRESVVFDSINGSPSLRKTSSSSQHPIPTLSSSPARPQTVPSPCPNHNHILALSPSFVFVAYPASPLLHIYSSSTSNYHLSEATPIDLTQPIALIPPPPGWSSPSRPDLITAVAVDQNRARFGKARERDPTRVAVWYASGGYVVLQIEAKQDETSALNSLVGLGTRTVTWRRLVTYQPPESLAKRNRRRHHIVSISDPVVLGSFHWPVLAACTQKFFISVYSLSDAETPTLLQTLHSPVSYHPATLSLEPVTDSQRNMDDSATDVTAESLDQEEGLRYLASLAYCSPLYPNSWTLTVQRIDISLQEGNLNSDVTAGESWSVARTLRHGGTWRSRIWPFRPRGEIVGVNGDQAVGIGINQSWGVLAGEDNQIQVYKLPRQNDLETERSKLPSVTTALKVIKHTQTLLAHASSITSLSLAGERCVSSGNDGRVLVWDLTQDAMIKPSQEGPEELEMATSQRSVNDALDYVEVSQGSTKAAPNEDRLVTNRGFRQDILPVPPVRHPLSLASAAREYISTASGQVESERRVIRNLAFNEDTIVGLVEEDAKDGTSNQVGDENKQPIVRVWKFDT